jgi:transcriptional regulator with XRE-family HTH domain
VPESERLGPLLLGLRTDRGLGQKQVAQLAEIDNSTLSRLESGGRGVSRETLDRLCDVLALDRRQRLEVMVAAGFLSEEWARVLADDDVNRLALLLTDPTLEPADAARLRQFVDLALAYAEARGYPRR